MTLMESLHSKRTRHSMWRNGLFVQDIGSGLIGEPHQKPCFGECYFKKWNTSSDSCHVSTERQLLPETG